MRARILQYNYNSTPNMSLEDPIIPQEYTHYASFTSLFILHMGIVCFENEEYVYEVIAMLLYLTTLCHWYYVKKTGFILETDKMMVKSCFLYGIIVLTNMNVVMFITLAHL